MLSDGDRIVLNGLIFMMMYYFCGHASRDSETGGAFCSNAPRKPDRQLVLHPYIMVEHGTDQILEKYFIHIMNKFSVTVILYLVLFL